MLADSQRRIARQPRHTVEVRVVAGKTSQPVVLHDCDNEGIAAEQARRLAYARRRQDKRGSNGQNLDSRIKDSCYRVTELRETLQRSPVLPETLLYYGGLPDRDRNDKPTYSH